MNNIKKLISKPLFLPIFCMLLVMAVNIIYDVASGNFAFNFFTISIRNGVLYGRMIDILNRGSEIAILAIGMTLVVSCSAGTDISVGSVMSLAASFCCMLLAGYGVSSTNELARPLIIGVLGGILIGCVCGAFNGFLVSYLNVQPMVATLILFSAARAIGLLLCNNMIVYVREDSFKIFGGYLGFIPTPIVVAAVCIIITSLILKKTALGLYVQSVGINKKASRIAGIKSERIIFLCYIVCGLCAGIAGIVASSRMQFLQLHLAVTVLAAESSVLPVLLSVHIRSRRSRQHCMRWVFPPNRHRYTRRSLLSSSLRSRRLRLRII